ncbi:MAG: cache domain-containing protein [Bdellovibrionales bacterium]
MPIKWGSVDASRVKPYVVVTFVTIVMLASCGIGIEKYRTSVIEERKETLRQTAESVHEIASFYYNKMEKEGLSEEEAKKYALQNIRQVSYDKNEYYWITNSRHIFVLHRATPQLEGKDFSQFIDSTGQKPIVRMREIAEKNGEGFMRYTWPQKPDSVSDNVFYQKMAFVKQIEPWGWTIGVGLYDEDINKACLKVFYIVCAMFVVTLLFIGAFAVTLRKQEEKPHV